MKSLGSTRQQTRKRCRTAWLAAAVGLLVCFAGAAAAASGGETAHQGFGASDWYRVMNFAVLAAVLFFLLRKPIPRALNGRIQGIREQLKDLEAKKSEAEQQLSEFNRKLGDLEKEADRIVSDYVRQGHDAKARILQEAEAAAEKIRSQASRNIEHEFAQAKVRLQQEIFEKSLAKAEEALKGKITGQDQDRLVEEYLQKVVAS